MLGARVLKVQALRALPLAVIIAIWFYLQGPGGVSPIVLPSIGAVASEFIGFLTSGMVYQHIAVTMGEILAALMLAGLLGFVVGFWGARSPLRAQVLEPLLVWGYLVPTILFYPLFLLWFGFGVWSKIAYAAVTAFFPVAFNCLRGFRRVERRYIDVGRAYGASSRQMDWLLKLPAALPMAVAGLKIGAALTMITVVVAEMIGSTQGLGFLIRSYSQSFAPARTYAIVLLVLVVVWIFHFMVKALLREERRVKGD